ncbi:MAG: PDZ domain-containing protein [Chthonomonadales bacterium]|nr:PDZ domain-containing protein [Chthonomonadales bacterium]
MKLRPAALLALLWACAAATAQTPEPIRFARHPALSPDGRTLAFTYHGDIWTVAATGGTAKRLTIHEAHDQLPVWSPNGKQIAFSSNRAGNHDVWVMPAEGGEPQQLTYHSASDSVCDWSPDGAEILFTSGRETTRTSAVYAVNVATGRSRLIRQDDIALSNARYTADGASILCTRGGSWTRRGYRGSGAANILAFPAAGGAGAFVTKSETNQRWPMHRAGSRSLLCVSDSSGAANLVEIPLAGGAERPITRFRDGAIYYPDLARDGTFAVFERDFRLWRVDVKRGDVREIVIYAPTDVRSNPVRRETLRSGVQELALSPDGRRLAFVIRGEVFVMPASGTGEPLRLTNTPEREEDITWSPDGKGLALISDRTGSAELYLLDVETRRMRQITRARKEPPASPAISPDGKTIAFVRGGADAELCLAPIEGGEPRVLVRDPSISEPRWSPDGKWIAYARVKSHSAGTLADVFLVNVADPKPVNITRYPVVNARPTWTRDGSRLFFVSNRSTVNHLFSVSMRGGPSSDGETDQARSEETPATGIDLKDIHLRARRVTSGGNAVINYAVMPDGRSALFTVGQLDRTDIWRIPASGGAPTRLTQTGENAASMQVSPDGSRLFYLAGGTIRRLDLAGPGSTPAAIPVSVDMVIDTRAELLHLFDEAWRKMRDRFYDPGMHGCDWNGVYERYRPIVRHLGTREDFYILFSLALGELNASHTGIGPGASSSGPQTASLGVGLDDTYTGPGVKVLSVMPDGPGARLKPPIQKGDVLLKLDGAEIRTNEHLYDLLADRSGKEIALTLQSPGGKESRTVRLRPITGAAYRQLEYARWVRERETMTDTLSGGSLLYVHLNSMNAENLEKFKRAALGDAGDKRGLILDMRFNGGGSIADEIFAVILNRVFGWRTIRGDVERSPAPLPSFTKPIIVLANESSLSNAEVFPWGFKALKLGKVVGVRTYGGVIGTGGTTLIDGTSLRMPAVGSFTLDGQNMENNGCPPDILVEHTPEDIVAGRDRQLERAVAELLKEIGKSPASIPRRQ